MEWLGFICRGAREWLASALSSEGAARFYTISGYGTARFYIRSG